MNQHDAVIQAMHENGGYATLGYLYRTALKVPGCHWGTKTPFASIRRIVQVHSAFFRIRPGLWGLTAQRDAVLRSLSLDIQAPQRKVEEFDHSYYQGLIVEIGNAHGYQTWIPSQDKNKLFLGKRLAEVASLNRVPPFTYEQLVSRASTVDVIWFNGRGFPDAMFEVEHSTNILNSLLKYVEFQDFRVNLNIVADDARHTEFESKVGNSAFTAICRDVHFIDYESLSQLHAKSSARTALEVALNI